MCVRRLVAKLDHAVARLGRGVQHVQIHTLSLSISSNELGGKSPTPGAELGSDVYCHTTFRFSGNHAHTSELARFQPRVVASVGSWTNGKGTLLGSNAAWSWNAPRSRGVLTSKKSIVAAIQSSAFLLKLQPLSFPFAYLASLRGMPPTSTEGRRKKSRFTPYSSA